MSNDNTRLQAMVFDMDGVIVDSHPAHRFAWREFLSTLGKEVSEKELDFVLDGRKRKDIFFHFLGPLTEAQLQEFGKLKDDLFWRASSEVTPVAGILDFIEDARRQRIPLAVATSASAKRTQSILTRLGILGHFAAIVTGEEVRQGKPDPSIYRLACQRICRDPRVSVAFEDAVSGVLSAKSAGLKCVAITSSQTKDNLTAAGADSVVRDFVSISVSDCHSLVQA